MILTEDQIRELLKKYEPDTTFNNEIVLSDVLDMRDTVLYWKRQAESFREALIKEQ